MQLPTLLSRNRREPEPEQAALEAEKDGKGEPKEAKEAKEPQAEEDPASASASEGGVTTNLLGSAVKSLMKKFDTSKLGVEVKVGELRIDACSGKVSLEDVMVTNPSGYHSEYLLTAKRMVVDVSMQSLLGSLGKTVRVQELDLQDVEVIYEAGLRTSNVDDVNKRLEKLKPKKKEKAGASASNSSIFSSVSESGPKPGEPEVILEKVSLVNVGARVATVFTRGMGPHIAMQDVTYPDFDAEMDPGHGVMDVSSALLQCLLLGVLATCKSKSRFSRLTGKMSSWAASASSSASDTAAAARQGLSDRISILSTQLPLASDGEWSWFSSCQSCQGLGDEIVVDAPGESSDPAAQGTQALDKAQQKSAAAADSVSSGVEELRAQLPSTTAPSSDRDWLAPCKSCQGVGEEMVVDPAPGASGTATNSVSSGFSALRAQFSSATAPSAA